MFGFLITDKEPPEFIDGECPEDIILYIDLSDNTALVYWAPPIGRDNSGEPPIIVEVHGYEPNTRFKAGAPHLVKYTIRDATGNIGSSCQFMITVNCKDINSRSKSKSYHTYKYIICVMSSVLLNFSEYAIISQNSYIQW